MVTTPVGSVPTKKTARVAIQAPTRITATSATKATMPNGSRRRRLRTGAGGSGRLGARPVGSSVAARAEAAPAGAAVVAVAVAPAARAPVAVVASPSAA